MENNRSVMETVIKIPDLRVVFDDETGAISFPNIKEIKLKHLIDVHFALQKALRQHPNVAVSKHGTILKEEQ
jgi:hypothetical protein